MVPAVEPGPPTVDQATPGNQPVVNEPEKNRQLGAILGGAKKLQPEQQDLDSSVIHQPTEELGKQLTGVPTRHSLPGPSVTSKTTMVKHART